MKTKIFAASAAIALGLIAVGCVSTVAGKKTAGVPLVKDTIEARYPRPMDQVYEAAKAVIRDNGTLTGEHVVYGRTNVLNNLSKVVEGKVNQRSVLVRVEQQEESITDIAVQVRTQGGGADIDLAAQIDKQIALKLVR
jgi:hypothetical protein